MKTFFFALLASGLLCLSCGDDSGQGNQNDNQNDNASDADIPEGCGNGTVEGAEECDDGAQNSDSTPDACRTNCTAAHCGDEVTDTGEECDDGAYNADTVPNACRRGCTLPTCGDGVPDDQYGEACDDGNNTDGDGCQHDCTLPNCGDGAVDPGEVCDDGNNVSGDGCNAWCTSDETCGNGIVDTAKGEECDDGNNDDADGCQADCKIPRCGDGVKDASEICDDGNTLDGDGCSQHCNSDETCGNGIVDIAVGEACDDGNNVDTDDCSNNCALPGCGDGILAGSEACDDGDNVNGTPGHPSCNAWCTSDETCGNGVIDPHMGEECDDGNNLSGDGCSPSCTVEICGNHVTDASEICDDGNNLSGDGCSSDCKSTEWCGNGITDVATGELCDDGNSDDTDGCLSDCTLPGCGDGVTDSGLGEVCDDGDRVNGTPGHPSCNAWCSSDETCGNGIVDTHMGEACDDGNNIDTDGCHNDCTLPACGDHIVDPGEACDDGDNVNGTPSHPGCNANCTSDETCGNGIVDVHMNEGCDDANSDEQDGCHSDCTLPSCGDHILDPGEACDDGDNVNGTPNHPSCNQWCTSDETCGNGIVDAHMGEQCDEGGANSDAPDATCRTDCTPGRCGDHIQDSGEACDDGNNNPCDGCAPDCSRVDDHCGDAIQECGEGCDLGTGVNSDAPDAACRVNCQPKRCGDGVLDPSNGEDCDTTVPAAEDCTSQGFYTGPLSCLSNCRFDISQCSGYCGNNQAETAYGEQCDGSDLPTSQCSDVQSPNPNQSFYGGTLSCLPTCAYNYAGCTGFCGDGVKNGAEQCDGYDFGTATCQTEGFYTGHLSCDNQCKMSTGSCSGVCGDGIKNGDEACDDNGSQSDYGNLTCANFGYYGGSLGCSGDCYTIETGSCSGYCGDGVINGNEQCDGMDRGGLNCSNNFTYIGGNLTCDSNCSFGGELCYMPGFQRVNSLTGVEGHSVYAYDRYHIYVAAGWKLYVYDGRWREFDSPGPAWMNAIHGTSPTNVIAVGNGGAVARWNGTGWSAITTPTTESLQDIWVLSTSSAWIVGLNGKVLRWNGGTSFNNYTLDSGSYDFYAVWATSATSAFVGGASGKLWRYNSGWTEMVDKPATGHTIRDLWGSSTGNVYAATSHAAMYAYIWHYDGSEWTPVTGLPSNPTRLFGVWGSSANDVWVAGTSGWLAHYNGDTWTAVDAGTSDDINDLWGSAAGDIWMVDENGLYLHQHGTDWQDLTFSPSSMIVSDLWVNSTGSAYAVGGEPGLGRIFYCSLTGICSEQTIPSVGWLMDIWAGSSSSLWAVGQDGAVLERVFSGMFYIWTNRSYGTADYNAVWGSGSYIWAVGDGGTIVRWNGSKWNTVIGAPTGGDDLYAIWGTSTTNYYIAGSNGRIIHWHGTGWDTLSTSGPHWRAIYGSSATDIWFAGYSGTIWRYNGSDWSVPDTGASSSMYFKGIAGTGPDDIWATGSESTVLHYDGNAWAPVEVAGLGSSAFMGPVAVRGTRVYIESGIIKRMDRHAPKINGGQCYGAVPIYCGQTIRSSNVNMPARFKSYTCAASQTASESIYRLQNPINGTVTVQLTPAAADLNLIALGPDTGDECDPTTCLDSSTHTGSAVDEVTITAIKGDSYFFVVDGPGSNEGSYDIQVTCTKED